MASSALSNGQGLSGQGSVSGTVHAPISAGVQAKTQVGEVLTNGTSPVSDSTLLQSASDSAGQAAAHVASSVPVEGAFTWSGYFQAIGVLLLLLAILWGVVWAVRKYGRFSFLPQPGAFPRDGLRLEAQLPLGPRKGLMVVRFLNKRLLLGVTDHQITLLKETGEHDEEDNLEFKEVMEAAQRQKLDD